MKKLISVLLALVLLLGAGLAAAEEARLTGKVVNIADFRLRHGKKEQA